VIKETEAEATEEAATTEDLDAQTIQETTTDE
jgi:hypothetical protein